MKKRFFNVAINLSITAFSILAALIAGEVWIRNTSLFERFAWHDPSPIRDRVSAYRKTIDPSKTFVIAAFGDSFVHFMRDCEGNFLHDAEKRLSAGKQVKILNFGYAGTGFKNYSANFEYVIKRMKVDAVLFNIYDGNDFLDYILAQEKVDRGLISADELSKSPPPDDHAVSLVQSLKKSVLINFIYRYVIKQWARIGYGHYLQQDVEELQKILGISGSIIQSRLKSTDPKYVHLACSDIMNPWLLAFGVVYPDVFIHNTAGLADAERTETIVNHFLEDIRKVILLCRDNRIQCSFTFIPADVNVSRQYHQYYRDLGYSIPDRLIRKPFFETRALEYLRGQGIPALSFWDCFHERDGRFYINRDGHWNREGNLLAGKVLAEFIQQRFTVP